MGGRLSLESRFPSFEEAIDVADEMRQRRHARGKTLAMRAIAALLIVAAICIGGFPAMLQYRSARDLSGTSVRSAQTVAGWPYPQADDAFAAAQDYNKRLAESGQPILGEAKDPFADVRGGSRASVSDSGESDQSEWCGYRRGRRFRGRWFRKRQFGGRGVPESVGFRRWRDGYDSHSENFRETADLPWYFRIGACFGLRATCTAAVCRSAARARMRCSPGIVDWSRRPCSRGLMKCVSATTSTSK